MISSVDSHRRAEERSIALHAAVAERLRADASLLPYEDIEMDAVGPALHGRVGDTMHAPMEESLRWLISR